MAFGRKSTSEIDGYRRAREGESPNMNLNGVDYIRDDVDSRDDGFFDAGFNNRYYNNNYFTSGGMRGVSSSGLRNSELSALDEQNSPSEASITENLRNKEESIGSRSNFRNNVRGERRNSKKKMSGHGFMRRAAPIITIVGMLCGVGGASIFGQAFMPFSLISQFQGNFDSIGISNNIRTRNFIKIQMDDSNVKKCVKSNIFGKEKFKISSRQKSKLAKSGIEVDKVNGETVLKFKDMDGVEKLVRASEFDAMYDANTKFHDAYYDGSKTWRGAVSDWFDDISEKFFKWIGLGRNNFASFKKSNDANTDQQAFKEKVASTADSDGASGSARSTVGEDVDSDGDGAVDDSRSTGTADDKLDIKRTDVDVDADGKITSTKKLGEKLTAFADGMGGKITGAASAIANSSCGILNVMGALGLIAAAYQATQVIKTASVIFEGIQKSQIEDSSTAPLNEIANSLTKKTKSTQLDKDGNDQEMPAKSAMEANSVAALFGNIKTNPNDPSVKSFNVMSSIGTFLGFGISSFKACTYAQLAASMADFVMDGIEIVGCALTLGLGCVATVLKNTVISAAASLTIAGAVQAVVPIFAKIVTRKIATEVAGEDLGNALVSGANMYMSNNHLYSGGSVANKSSLTKFIAQRDIILADQARYERSTLSPFDSSSQYTFMGTLLTSIAPLLTQTSSVASSIGSFSGVVTKSFLNIIPGASAVSAGVTIQEAADNTARNCLYLDSIGAVGDVFCNPYIITDIDTITTHPADIVDKVASLGGFEDDKEQEVPTIKEDSNLGKYIIYCGQRQSPFGMPDQNISGQITSGTSTGNAAGDALVGSIPLAGDLVGALENREVIKNYGYISGESCVTGSQGEEEVPSWDETRYYQRFIEDQRLAENMGLTEKSAVTAFLDNYYEKNPIDNSYEGILARRSGLTKETVIAGIEEMEKIVFYANYDPTNLYPIIREPGTDMVEIQIEKTNTVQANNYILKDDNSFFEERKIRAYAI